MQRRHVPIPQTNSSGGTHIQATRGERGALQRQVPTHTPPQGKIKQATTRQTPEDRKTTPKEWQIQQCGGRVSWCRCRTRKEKKKKKKRKQENAAHPLQAQQQQQKSTNHCPTGRGTPTHSTAQVYTLQPTTTTSPTPNARKHARPLLRTQKSCSGRTHRKTAGMRGGIVTQVHTLRKKKGEK